MPDFLIYCTDAGVEVRAKVIKRNKNGSAKVEPYFFQRDGKDVAGFIGGAVTVLPRHIVTEV